MKRIICFHLFNDYSGSPRMFSMIIRGLVLRGYLVELYTSKSEGFLSGLEGVNYHLFNYKWTSNKIFTFFRLLYAQLYMFFSSLKYGKRKSVLFYINTICPIGAVFSAAFRGIPMIYHVHEKYVDPNVLHLFYESVWKRYATNSIFVSKYLQKQYYKENMRSCVVYNALSEDFLNHVVNKNERSKPYNILMICSLKKYKGIYVFLELAKRLPQYDFSLVVNSSQHEIDAFFSESVPNLKIYPAQKEVSTFLYKADLLLNLTIPSFCVETFGLTLLEAMAYGLPVIAPPAGGPVELVKDGYNGFLVDSRNIEDVIEKIVYTLESGRYEVMSENAKKQSLLFNHIDMMNRIEKLIECI